MNTSTTTHNEGYYAILDSKYARIIHQISKMHNISHLQALDIFYNSPILPLLQQGVADLHCRSDQYIAEEIWSEYLEKTN